MPWSSDLSDPRHIWARARTARFVFLLLPIAAFQFAFAASLALGDATTWTSPRYAPVFALATRQGWALPFLLAGVLILAGAVRPVASYFGLCLAAGLWGFFGATLALTAPSPAMIGGGVLAFGLVTMLTLGIASLPVTERLDLFGPFRRR